MTAIEWRAVAPTLPFVGLIVQKMNKAHLRRSESSQSTAAAFASPSSEPGAFSHGPVPCAGEPLPLKEEIE
ncbi:hypothetical protein I0D68_05370 [Pseudomonas lalucatii]|nr:hypothetical protein I0D68_05370 [Pseudomonas lalucatii]